MILDRKIIPLWVFVLTIMFMRLGEET